MTENTLRLILVCSPLACFALAFGIWRFCSWRDAKQKALHERILRRAMGE